MSTISTSGHPDPEDDGRQTSALEDDLVLLDFEACRIGLSLDAQEERACYCEPCGEEGRVAIFFVQFCQSRFHGCHFQDEKKKGGDFGMRGFKLRLNMVTLMLTSIMLAHVWVTICTLEVGLPVHNRTDPHPAPQHPTSTTHHSCEITISEEIVFERYETVPVSR